MAELCFPPFRLDPVNEQVWCDGQLVPLRPKLFAILRYLVEHAGRLVSREELTKAVWPDTVISDSVLRGCLRALREALGDKAAEPRFIETVARRGYRFLAPLTAASPAEGSPFDVQPADAGARTSDAGLFPASNTLHPTSTLVGREAELSQLQTVWHKALAGQRQVVFVTGEPGIGKTTVVEAFLKLIANPQSSTPSLWIGRGQCVEQYGAGEAYLPVLEALSRMCREPGGERLIRLLRRHAPTWLVQLPALLSAAEQEAVQRKVQGATRERMLREFTEAIEVLTAETPLVLLLEDLHWSDYATIDLLALLARLREAARLLVLGTYRPADVAMSGHPLKAAKQELQTHGQCEELALTFLTDVAVGQYLDARFPHHRFPPALAQMIYRSTDGNALFMVNTVDSLVQQGTVSEQDGQWQLQVPLHEVAVGAPENMRQLIEKQIERLGEEQQWLEVASVVGAEFSAAVLTAGGIDAQRSEERCEGLIRRGQFLQARGVAEWPDGTVATRYGFLHALYQQVLYERIPVGRRVRLHHQIGEVLEAGYGARSSEIAAELALHFERGHEYRRAVQYHGQAAQTALQRSALHETMTHLHQALELLATLPDTPERAQQELSLQVTLGVASIAAKGFGASEVEHAFARARALSQQFEDSPQSFPILIGLGVFYLSRSEFQTGLALAEQCLRLAEQAQDPALLITAHLYVGANLHYLGNLPATQRHYEHALQLHDPQQHRSLAFLSGTDPGIASGAMLSWVFWHLGYPDQALRRSQQANTLARDLGHANTSAAVLAIQGFCHLLRGELQAVQTLMKEEAALCAEQGVPTFLAISVIFQGWVFVMQGQWEEGLTRMRSGLADYRATGIRANTPWYLSLLADACGKAGRIEEGLEALTEAFAFVEQTDERCYETELYRIKGTLTLRSQTSLKQVSDKSHASQTESKDTNPQHLTPNTHAEADAEACFLKAIDIAQRQQAKSLELRAVVSLARLWHQQGRTAEARRQLAEVYEWFTEGWNTADLLEAQSLLTELGYAPVLK
jgi:DNA-binding winged helix-turn-helix (wHTH) protein/predicted ATPase